MTHVEQLEPAQTRQNNVAIAVNDPRIVELLHAADDRLGVYRVDALIERMLLAAIEQDR